MNHGRSGAALSLARASVSFSRKHPAPVGRHLSRCLTCGRHDSAALARVSSRGKLDGEKGQREGTETGVRGLADMDALDSGHKFRPGLGGQVSGDVTAQLRVKRKLKEGHLVF